MKKNSNFVSQIFFKIFVSFLLLALSFFAANRIQYHVASKILPTAKALHWVTIEKELIHNIVSLARMLSRTDDPYLTKTYREELILKTEELQDIHEQLLDDKGIAKSIPAELAEIIKTVYFKQPDILDQRIRDFVKAAHNYANAPYHGWQNRDLQFILYVEQYNEVTLALDGVVSGIQKIHENIIKLHSFFENLFALSAILAFALILFFILRPLFSQMKDDRALLTDTNRLLGKSVWKANEARAKAEEAEKKVIGLADDLAKLTEQLSEANRSLEKEVKSKEYGERLQRHRNRVLSYLSEGADLKKIMETTVRMVENLQPDKVCSILLYDESAKCWTAAAAPSLPMALTARWVEKAEGLRAKEAELLLRKHEGEQINFELAPWRDMGIIENLKAFGLKSMSMQNIESPQQEFFGVLMVCMKHSDALSEKDIDFLRNTAKLAGIAVERKHTDRKLEEVAAQLRANNERLRDLVATDPLTGLLNRRGLQQALSHEIEIIRRKHVPCVVFLIDLDNFKNLNEQFGYAVGDIVLREIGKILKSTFRATDYVARIGGDEFLALLPETQMSEGRHFSERVRLAIAGKSILVAGGKTIRTTASIGVSDVTPETTSVDELLEETHIVLSLSKNAGKNCVRFNNEQFENDDAEFTSAVNELRKAGSYYTMKHAIYDLSRQKEIGYEFLSRSTVDGFQMPNDFFKLSNEENILTMVDHHCLRSSISAAAKMDQGLRKHLNLMPSTMIDIPADNIIDMFPENMKRSDFCVEISEQQIIGDPSYLLSTVMKLRKAGIRIAVDDVGFGQSCLESLILLQPDVVKIDQKSVKGVHADRSKRESLKRLLKAVQSLDTEIIAEGIEETEDLSVVRDLGVLYGQGFYWGKPVPAVSSLSKAV